MRNLIPKPRREDLLQEFFNMNKWFENFFSRPFEIDFASSNLPAVDVYERDDKVIVKAELPGVKPEEVDISVSDGGTLTISGEKKFEDEVKREDYYRFESRYGRFSRSVELPSDVKAEEAKATYKDGLLKIELPKTENKKAKKIKIDIS